MTDDRILDWDEVEPVNRPQDEPDDWEANCLSEDAHRRMLEAVYREVRERRQHEKI